MQPAPPWLVLLNNGLETERIEVKSFSDVLRGLEQVWSQRILDSDEENIARSDSKLRVYRIGRRFDL